MTPFNDVRFGLLGGSIVDSNALLRAYIWHWRGDPDHRHSHVHGECTSGACAKDGGISGPAPVMLESENQGT